jgi:WS/DGAT/MGAT family acyltransferase
MHRLSGEDAGFLSMESPAQPMNTIAVGVFRPAPGAGPVTRADLRSHLERRLDQLPSFRWRIVKVPLRLHHPVAVRDPQFDLDFHVRHLELEPGPDGRRGDAELEALFCRLAERRLDRRHPLWQATLVDGFDDGRQALILKYHHCLADGVAALTTFTRVYSDQATPPIPGEPVPWYPEKLPGRARLIGGALADHARGLVRAPGLAARTKRGMARVKARRAAAKVRTPEFSGEAPRCELNDAFTTPRAYARVALDLAEVKRVKDEAGVSLNDVALAVIAGGLRGYLDERGALPAEPLLASVPVSYEPADAPLRQAGNRFWSFTTSLATDVADPAERLAAISEVAGEARGQLDDLGPDLLPTWLDLVPPLIADPGARALVQRLRDGDGPVDANVLISNIRGPAERWSIFGTTLEDLYLDGPPSNGVGCNVMLWSYGDRLLFGVLAFADALRDPASFTAHCHAAFDELRAAVAS